MQLALKHLINPTLSPDVILTIPAGQSIVLENITWQAFETLLVELGNSRAAAIAYDQGILEIMAPLPEHEYYTEETADLIKDLAEVLEIDYETLGSTTWKRPDLLVGVEPDNCFYVQNEQLIRGKLKFDLLQDPPPDLVVKVDITHKSLNRLPIYAQLEVPQIWRYEQEQIKIYQLQNSVYVDSSSSLAFPGFPVEQIIPFIQSNKALGKRNMRLAFRALVKQIEDA